MAQNKPTTDEHFIPQFYLKQFSADGAKIYQYNVSKDKIFFDAVPIKSICYERNLYEFKNDSGEFVERNIIENALSQYEGIFAETISKIQTKAVYKENYDTLCFLSAMEKMILMLFIATLMLRSPEILDVGAETALEFWDNNISEAMAKNIALQYCLPVYNKFDPTEKNLLSVVLNRLSNMSFQVMITDDDVFFTSDKPLIARGKNENLDLESISLPLSPRIMLNLQSLTTTKAEYKNRLIHIDNDISRSLNGGIVANNNRWVYSKYPITKSQIKWIKKKNMPKP